MKKKRKTCIIHSTIINKNMAKKYIYHIGMYSGKLADFISWNVGKN